MATPPNRSRFLRNAIRICVIGQLPASWLLYRAVTSLGAPWPGLITLGILAWLNTGLMVYIRHAFPERPIGRALQIPLVLPFFLWFMTSGVLLIPASILAVLTGLVALATEGATRALWLGRLDLASLGVVSLGVALAFYACFVRRRWVETTELDVHIPGLPPAFEGFRIVQLSDLHIGNFSPRHWLDRWVDHANRLEPDLVAVTGDLLNSGEHFMGEVTGGLARLAGRHGVVVSMGNHDYWSGGDELATALEGAGLEVMRNTGRRVHRGEESIYLAAVDDTWTRRDDIDLALAEWPRDIPAILLAHDPALYPAAVARGVALTLSGHTHGGQLAIPFKARWNLSARVYRHSVGVYQQAGSTLFVHRGLGTTGPPVRLGAAPEIAVLVLRGGVQSS